MKKKRRVYTIIIGIVKFSHRNLYKIVWWSMLDYIHSRRWNCTNVEIINRGTNAGVCCDVKRFGFRGLARRGPSGVRENAKWMEKRKKKKIDSEKNGFPAPFDVFPVFRPFRISESGRPAIFRRVFASVPLNVSFRKSELTPESLVWMVSARKRESNCARPPTWWDER